MSQRRILLIDSDPAFHITLEEVVSRHGVAVERDPDANALTRAASAPPELLVIAADEPDKVGYALCNKAKKGPLVSVPVLLVTSTISAESFANHRKLKLHADEYLDKRTIDRAELHAAIDRLINLGVEVLEAELPIEVDDDAVEIADSELILEESSAEHEAEAGPPISPELTLDALFDAETEAAFAALTGEEDSSMNTSTGTPALAPADEPGPLASEASGEVVSEAPEEVVSEASDDGRRARAATPSEISISEAEELDVYEPPSNSPQGRAIAATPRPPSEPAAPAVEPVLEPAAMALTETADLELEPLPSTAAPPRTPGPQDRLDAALSAANRSISKPGAPERARLAALPPSAVTAGPNEATAPAALAYSLENLPTGRASAEAARPTEPAAEPPRRRSSPRFADLPAMPSSLASTEEPPRRPRTNLDLGLDEVAERADREQSGVFDRRALHRTAELERENHQLRAELSRARGTGGEAAKTPIEREFFALREAMVTKEREVTTLRETMASKERELTVERDRLRQLQHAKATIEQKNHELEARLLAETERTSAADSTQRAAAAQVSALRQEIDARTQAVAAAESARASAERELAAERMARMAMAAKAEESAGQERASLEEYFRSEISAARANAAAERDTAVAEALAEVEREHDRALTALREAHRADLEEREGQARDALARSLAEERAQAEKVRRDAEAARQTLLASKDSELANQLSDAVARAGEEAATLRRQHVAELERLAATHEQALVAASAEREHLAEELDGLRARHRAELEALRTEHARELRTIEEHQARVVDELRAELSFARDGLAASETAGDKARQAQQQTAAELAGAQRELATLREELQQAQADGQRGTQELRSQHAAALAKLRADTDLALTKARIDGEAATAKAKVDGEQALAKAKGEAEAALAKLRGEHAGALTKARAEAEAALAKVRAELEAVRAEGTTEHQAALASALQERDELRAGLTSARDQLRQLEGALAQRQDELGARDAELAAHAQAVAARDQRLTELRAELEAIEAENAGYQEQVLKAYQKIKQDEAMVTRAKKALAIAFNVLDDEKPPSP